MAAKLRGGSRDGHANGAERAGICIAGREGFFHASGGGEKGCSLGFVSSRDPDIFGAGLSPLGWAQRAAGYEGEEKCSQMKQNTFFFFFLLRDCQGYLERGLKSFPGSEECLSELLLDNRLSC